VQTELFRKSALQELSSPEQLEQFMEVTRPRAWIALGAIGLILVAAVIWSVWGTLPTKVSGQGIIIRAGGVFDIASQGGGVITDIRDLRVGDKVSKGQVLGHIAQPALEQQRKAADVELGRLRAEEREILAVFRAESPINDDVLRMQRDGQQKIIQAKEEHLASLRTVLRQQAELLQDGLIIQQRYEETRQAIFAAENDIRDAGNTLRKLTIEKMQTADQRDERRRDISARIDQARNKLDELNLRHELAATIVSQDDGQVVEKMAVRGDNVKSGQSILSVEIEARNFEAVIYLPPASNAKRLEPGMIAQISLATAKKERYGYLIGKVATVSKYPSTVQGMMSVLENQQLVQEMSKSGPPIAVLVTLIPDAATRSGYRWSSKAGASLDLSSGTLTTADIVVEENRPITLILPLLKEALGR
jgi:NHLM bacteriocin system secretion protein